MFAHPGLVITTCLRAITRAALCQPAPPDRTGRPCQRPCPVAYFQGHWGRQCCHWIDGWHAADPCAEGGARAAAGGLAIRSGHAGAAGSSGSGAGGDFRAIISIGPGSTRLRTQRRTPVSTSALAAYGSAGVGAAYAPRRADADEADAMISAASAFVGQPDMDHPARSWEGRLDFRRSGAHLTR